MGIRRSTGKNKKNKRPAAAASVQRDDTRRKGQADAASRRRDTK